MNRGFALLAQRWLIVTLWVITIVAATLGPADASGGVPRILCVFCGSGGAADLVLNVALFLPLGYALARAGLPAWSALLVSLLFSTGIEVAQLALPFRSPTLRDVLANAAGGWLGAVGALNIRSWLRPSTATNIRFVFATALPLAIIAAGGALLRSARVNVETLDSQWEPEFARPGNRWNGELRSVRIGDVSIPNGRVLIDSALRQHLDAGSPLLLDIRAAASTDGYMPILNLAIAIDERWLVIAQRDEDLVLHTRRRSAALRLRGPSVTFPRLLAVAPGDSLAIRIEGLSTLGPCAESNGVRVCAEQLPAGRLWSLLVPSSRWDGALLDALTFVALGVPSGLLLLVAAGWLRVVGLATVALGLVILPSALGFVALASADWLSIGLGMAVGTLTSARLRESVPGARPH